MSRGDRKVHIPELIGYSSIQLLKCLPPGMPGVGITPIICSHAVTLDEFMTIYNIFKQYEGLDTLRMNQKEQDEWNERIKLCEQLDN